MNFGLLCDLKDLEEERGGQSYSISTSGKNGNNPRYIFAGRHRDRGAGYHSPPAQHRLPGLALADSEFMHEIINDLRTAAFVIVTQNGIDCPTLIGIHNKPPADNAVN